MAGSRGRLKSAFQASLVPAGDGSRIQLCGDGKTRVLGDNALGVAQSTNDLAAGQLTREPDSQWRWARISNGWWNIRNVCVSYIMQGMGIVKISDQMHESLRIASNALSRSINAQAEHWMRIGLLAELHPDLDHREICQLLIRAEQAGGFDLATAAACRTASLLPSAPVISAGSKGMQ